MAISFERKEPKRRIQIKRDPYFLPANQRKAGPMKNKKHKNKKDSIEQNLEENDSE